MRERVRAALEGVVIGAIILVLIQTFLEDFATVVGWSWSVRRVLIFTGFFFDLFFTVEFLIRLYTSVFQGRGLEYFVHRRGWIDFVASIPLLLLSSGPAVLTVVTGGTMVFAVGSILNVLKVIKAIRIARILRLLRVLKVFKQIKYTDSVMAQRHVAKITSMTVTLFVFVVFVGTIVGGLIGIPSVDEVIAEKHQETVDSVVELSGGLVDSATAHRIAERDADLLIVKTDGETVYSRHGNDHYRTMYGPSDYRYVALDRVEFFFDNTTVNNMQSKDNLLYFLIIVLLVIFLLVYYSPHFALTVTDPIHVMRRGMEDNSYNFEVKIPDRYRNDDIYRLAEMYNAVYLPLKDRSQDAGESQSSLLDFDDVKDLLGDE